MRSFALGDRYALVIIPFRAFLHNLTRDDQLAALRSAHAHLRPGGELALNVFHPSLEYMAANAGAYAGVWRWRATRTVDGGGFVVYSETTRYDTVKQRLEAMIRTEEFGADGALQRTDMMHLELAYLYPSDITALLAESGFRVAAHIRRFSRPPVRTRRRRACGGSAKAVSYHHTQFGWVTLGTTVVVLLAVAVGLWSSDAATLLLVTTIIAMLGLLFGWLTVDVDDRRLLMTMGIGLIRRNIPLSMVHAFAPVSNRWYYGWGVRITPYGMLYNVSGLRAVEVLFENGRRVRIGTDEPEALVRALSAATHKLGLASPDTFPRDTGWRNRVRFFSGGIGAIAVVCIAWMFYVYSQPPSIDISNLRFEVGVGLHSADMPLADIQSVTLVDELPRVLRRTNGFSSHRVLRGNFRLEQWGTGKLFIDRNAPPYLVLRSRDTFVAVNFADPSADARSVRQAQRSGSRSKARSRTPMRRVRYSVAATLDGFIADPDGGYDWIIMDEAIDFAAMFAEFDTFVMGRKTWDVSAADRSS